MIHAQIGQELRTGTTTIDYICSFRGFFVNNKLEYISVFLKSFDLPLAVN